MPCMSITLPRVQFVKFFQKKLFPDPALSYHTVLLGAGYFI